MGNITIKSRFTGFKPSVFSEFSRIAVEYQAINLSQGFPDFDGPESIKEAAIDAIYRGKNQYAPSAGIFELRSSIAKRYQSKFGIDYNPDTEITVFSGATEALFCAILGLVEPGDEVLSFEPFFDVYPSATFAAGGIFCPVALKEKSWGIDFKELSRSITKKTKILILNTPHNPTGKVFSSAEIESIAELAHAHDLWVVTDEVYDELIFEKSSQYVCPAALGGLRARTITINSTGKTFSMTGWKIGYACAPPEVTSILRRIHENTVFSTATPLQWGMVEGFKLGNDYLASLREEYSERRALLKQALEESLFEVYPNEGTYFFVANYRALSDLEDRQFCLRLIKELGVAPLPMAPFYQRNAPKHLVRFGFCKSLETLFEAGKRLRRVHEKKEALR